MQCMFSKTVMKLSPLFLFFVLFCFKFWHLVKTGFNKLQVFFWFTFYKKKPCS